MSALSASISFVLPTNSYAVQSVPYQMNFQGRLNDSTGAPMPNGTYNMKFRIYSVASGGSSLWSEQRSVFSGTGVTITTGGLFSVQLGSVTSLPPSIFNSATPLYLEVELPTPATATCSTSGCESYTEGAMTPRNPVVSSPFAVNSDLLDGLDSSAFAASSGSTSYIQNTASPQGASFNVTGTGTVGGTFTANGQVVFKNSANSTGTFQVQNAAGGAILSVDTTANQTNVIGDLNLTQVAAPTTTVTPTIGTTGSVTGTNLSYVVTYITANGETEPSSWSAAVSPSSQQVNITNIPVSPSKLVTARKIYRSTGSSGAYLVATINDNTTTSYTDNTATPGVAVRWFNTTAGLLQNGVSLLQLDTANTNLSLGPDSLSANIDGYENTAVGINSLYANTHGGDNTALGLNSLYANTTGTYNSGVGVNALGSNTTGSSNTALGSSSLGQNTTGSNNTALGFNAGNQDSNGTFSTGATIQNATAIGAYAQVTQNNSLVLGSVDQGTKIGIGITSPSNLLSVSPLDYQTGTVKRTNGSPSLNGSGTTWTAAMIGDIVVFADGTTNTITGFTNATFVTMGTIYTGTTDPGTIAYRFHKPGFQVTSAGNAFVQNTSTTAFQVQNASGIAALSVDTTTNTISLGSVSSGNYLSFSPSGGLVANGTTRHTKTILLTPEYAGAVLDAASDASCSSANSGTMTAGYDSTNRMNYYNWTSTSGTAQCYDVVVQVPIPSDFSSWSGTPDIEISKDSTGTAAYAIQIIPSSGTDANYNTYVSPGTLGTSWANMATSALSGTYTAGNYLTIKLRASSTSSANVKLGNIKLTYNSSF